MSFWTIPCEWSFACWPSFGFRSTRNGANAPGQTTSIIATSIDDEFVENALASCEYDASDAAGCGTTFTLMPVCFENFFASARSRACPPPTESPTNVIVCPPYFDLIDAAFGTDGAGVAAAETAFALPPVLFVAAAATLIETSRAKRASPATTTLARCFTSLSFL